MSAREDTPLAIIPPVSPGRSVEKESHDPPPLTDVEGPGLSPTLGPGLSNQAFSSRLKTALILLRPQLMSLSLMMRGGASRMTFSCVSLQSRPSFISSSQ